MGEESVNALRLDREELEALLCNLNVETDVSAEDSLRRTRRWGVQYQNAVLTIEERRDAHTHFIVLPRNLSTGGLSVLHGGYIHPDTPCLVSMRTNGGTTKSHAGTVLRCQYISGRIHELGIRFHDPINPRDYLINRDGQDVFNVEHVEPADLEGTVLIVMGTAEHQREVYEELRHSEMELLYARDGKSGLAMLDEQPDLMYVGCALSDMSTVEFFREAQQRGDVPPTIVIGEESVLAQRALFLEAGAVEVLARPFESELILRSAAEYLLLADVLAIESNDSSIRAVSSQPAVDITEIGEQLFDALLGERLNDIIELTDQVQRIAISHGYAVVARRAKRLAQEIAEEERLVVSTTSLLIKACRRLNPKTQERTVLATDQEEAS